MMEEGTPIGVLGRAERVLAAFAPHGGALRFTEVAELTGLPKATVHRILQELMQLRFIERDRDQRFRLGARLFELGMLASVGRGLIEIATPFLQDLYERSHETVHLGIREGAEVVYISKIGGHRQARMPSTVGGRMPLHCTAIGKVLLAFGDREKTGALLRSPLRRLTGRTITVPGLLQKQLDAALIDGVAYEQEESALGVVCIAAPILDTDDRPVAAVSIAGNAARFKPEGYADAIRSAAVGISSTLARRAALIDEVKNR